MKKNEKKKKSFLNISNLIDDDLGNDHDDIDITMDILDDNVEAWMDIEFAEQDGDFVVEQQSENKEESSSQAAADESASSDTVVEGEEISSSSMEAPQNNDASADDIEAIAPIDVGAVDLPDEAQSNNETLESVSEQNSDIEQVELVNEESQNDDALIDSNTDAEDASEDDSVNQVDEGEVMPVEPIDATSTDIDQSSAESLPVKYGNFLKTQEQQGGASGGSSLRTYGRDVTATDHDEADEELRMREKGLIGNRMVEQGLITESQLNVALHEKSMSSKLFGEILVELGFIDDETLTAFLAEASGHKVFDPKSTIFDGDVLAYLEKPTAQKHKVLPLSANQYEIFVAMADPYDVVALDTLRRFIPKNLKVVPQVSTAAVLSDAIDAAYGYASSVNAILKELEKIDDEAELDLSNLDEDEAFSHPIVRLVNALVFEAVKVGVSDLHFEPEENFVRLRYRKDGVLYTAQIIHKQHWNGISQRLKIMSKMNIADKLSPQDGRFGMSVNGKEADFRVSSLPTVHGENIVLRVLDQSASIMPMEKLGFSDHNLALIKESQAKPEGIIIVTGPTGSGKTTSLYSMLNEINDVEVNIQTLEDPVEYSLPMIRQTHVREGVLEFSDGIKALLRQDPDIIFIGEIRDGETAGMALKAAMTGHQVYTTLHTNDSFGAIPRLFDLGLKPGMVAGAIIAIFAQRLTRCLCPNCKQAYKPDSEECAILGVEPEDPPTIYRQKFDGCNMCEGTGCKGRTAVVEILTFDEEMDELLAGGRSKAELKVAAVKKGFKSMKDDGIIKVLEGKISLEALAKVVDIRK